MINSYKQILWSSSQNHMRSILHLISYVEDCEKLFKGWLVKSRTHTLRLHSPSTLQEELLATAEHYDYA